MPVAEHTAGMTAPKRYAVPVEQLDAVHVPTADQVQEERAVAPPDAGTWGGSLVPPYGDGGAHDGDSD